MIAGEAKIADGCPVRRGLLLVMRDARVMLVMMRAHRDSAARLRAADPLAHGGGSGDRSDEERYGERDRLQKRSHGVQHSIPSPKFSRSGEVRNAYLTPRPLQLNAAQPQGVPDH